MFKNVAGQKIQMFAFDYSTGAPKTGDAANITPYIAKDGGAVTALTDTSATELSSTNAAGWYEFDVSQTESNADMVLFTGKSSTANVAVVGMRMLTRPNRFTTLVIDAAGLADANMVKAGPTGSGTAQTARDIGGAVPAAAAGASGGLLISGSNSGTTTLGALTVTGATTLTGAVAAASVSNDIRIGATERAAIVDEVWDEVLTGATHNVTSSAGKRLRELGGSIVTSGTAQAGATASITLAAAASSTNGTYDPAIVRIVAGTGIGQARLIIDYVGSTRVASVDRDWRVAPDNTSEYEIIASANLISTNEGLATGGGANTITLNANASSTTNAYRGQLVVLRTGTGQDQARLVTAYNGTTKVATVGEAWTTNPAAGTGYIMWPVGRALVAEMAADTLTASALAADAVTEIQSGLATAAALVTAQADLDNIQTRLPAALVGGRMDASVGAMAANVMTAAAAAADLTTELQSGLATAAAVAALNNISAAQVNAEVVDALNTDTYAEPGQGAPAATASIAAKLGYLYKAWRNRTTQTATTYSLYADDATTVDQKATVSDDATTFSRTEVTTGP